MPVTGNSSPSAANARVNGSPNQAVNPGGNPPNGNKNTPRQNVIVWWVPFIILMMWNLIGYFYHPNAIESATIPYTTFIEQVKADNVTKLDLKGAQIIGVFRHPTVLPKSVLDAGNLFHEKQKSDLAGKLPKNSKAEPAVNTDAKADAAKTPDKETVQVVDSQKAQIPATITKTETLKKPVSYDMFYTVFPETLGDPQLLPLLEQHKVDIVAFSNTSPWFVKLFWNVMPFVLLVLFFSWMGKRAAKQQGSIFGIGQSTSKRVDSSSQRVNITFDDVAGADVAKQQLMETVSFLKEPHKFQTLGAKIPRGALLAGPPGTGKTLLAKAVAGEAGVPFFSASGSEFMQMFVGVGASRVRDLFEQAKKEAPAIIFIDKLDAIGRRRSSNQGMGNDEREQTLNQLLVTMDGFDDNSNIVILAATNRPDVLDPALLRPGRFDRLITVGLPDIDGREQIIKVHSRKLTLADDVNFRLIATMTIGMSGAQLANLCNEAALHAARQKQTQVGQNDFEQALDKVILGDARPLVMDEHTRNVIAYHEGGHALVAWLMPKADPVHKVTIVPHGQALGVTEQRPGADQYNFPKSYLLDRLAVMLGGRVAEDIVFGDITTGAENDLVQATRLARHMVTAWGMSDLGPVAYEESGQDAFLGYNPYQAPAYSATTAARIDELVNELLRERYQTVKDLLQAARKQLDQLASALLETESVNHDQLVTLLGVPVHARQGNQQPVNNPEKKYHV